MPLVYQQNINATTKIGVWNITENEEFFLKKVPLKREIHHWHKRLQHLAGRLLLKEMHPGFPLSLIKIADTKKPYLENEPYHFSISHCGNFAAVVVSTTHRVGVDVELLSPKIERLQQKFMNEEELPVLYRQCPMPVMQSLTLYWSVKESVFKWWSIGEVDFKKDIVLKSINGNPQQGIVECHFKNKYQLEVYYIFISNNYLTWVLTS
ncbi:MAG: 4'-phosphopantetheinyl transferase superfamily protein [Ferruginibacter sp.]|nr:4'-phosphopantetheinyl transferase superfamily protein [Bacteroidota bacterium]MBX2919543.1 4'-phosphopantetheinyl transferase superfamily protein [Ferruginibacter sp.]MCC7378846.1 4'-phosphopantetheinyl transferase superfamily protein [Chitinophagaceae bacterium]